jgi:hypothetical protein
VRTGLTASRGPIAVPAQNAEPVLWPATLLEIPVHRVSVSCQLPSMRRAVVTNMIEGEKMDLRLSAARTAPAVCREHLITESLRGCPMFRIVLQRIKPVTGACSLAFLFRCFWAKGIFACEPLVDMFDVVLVVICSPYFWIYVRHVNQFPEMDGREA